VRNNRTNVLLKVRENVGTAQITLQGLLQPHRVMERLAPSNQVYDAPDLLNA